MKSKLKTYISIEKNVWEVKNTMWNMFTMLCLSR